jgi:hypothetical protein
LSLEKGPFHSKTWPEAGPAARHSPVEAVEAASGEKNASKQAIPSVKWPWPAMHFEFFRMGPVAP